MKLLGYIFVSILFFSFFPSITGERKTQNSSTPCARTEYMQLLRTMRTDLVFLSLSLSMTEKKAENEERKERKTIPAARKWISAWATVVNQIPCPTLPVLCVFLSKGPGLVGNRGELEVGLFATRKPMVPV